MIRAFRAELVKLLRRRVLLVTALVTVVFSVGGAALVLTSAEPARSADRDGRALTIDDLSRAGGGTEVFTSAISFAGTFLFVVFVGAVAAEFSRGTIRTNALAPTGARAAARGQDGRHAGLRGRRARRR
jgi:ABC-2 type transport system permease protein